MKRLTALTLTLLASISACSAHKPAPTTAASARAHSTEPVIVRLVGRDSTITILAGPGHTIYSATDTQNNTIVSKATLDELKTTHPDLYQRVAPGVTAYAGMDIGGI